jgi:hypothetical protein
MLPLTMSIGRLQSLFKRSSLALLIIAGTIGIVYRFNAVVLPSSRLSGVTTIS